MPERADPIGSMKNPGLSTAFMGPPEAPAVPSDAPSAPAMSEGTVSFRERAASTADASQSLLPPASLAALTRTRDRGGLFRLWTLLRVEPSLIVWGALWQALQAISHIPFPAGPGNFFDGILPGGRPISKTKYAV